MNILHKLQFIAGRRGIPGHKGALGEERREACRGEPREREGGLRMLEKEKEYLRKRGKGGTRRHEESKGG